MSKNSYAEEINHAQLMVSGLSQEAERVARRGITTEFIQRLEMQTAEAIMLNNEQEKLKADLKMKTAALTDKLTEIAKQLSEAKKIVKLDFPKSQWREFGIDDKA